jgi:hypothetical protein
VVFWDGSGILTAPSGTRPVPAQVCNHRLRVAKASHASKRTCEDESGEWARCTSVATTFLVFVMAVTAPGSVVKLYRVAMAKSFSSMSLRMAHDVSRCKTPGRVASSVLLPASADKFCKVRRANIRLSAFEALAAATSVSTRPSKRVKMRLLAAKRERLLRISRHFE